MALLRSERPCCSRRSPGSPLKGFMEIDIPPVRPPLLLSPCSIVVGSMRMEPSSSLSPCPSRHHNSLIRSVAVHMHGLESWPKCARARARIVRVRVRKNFFSESLHLSVKCLFFALLSLTNNK